MMQITFHDDGRIAVYVYSDGTTLSVTSEINKLRELLPGQTYDAMRNRCAALVKMTAPIEAGRIAAKQ